MSERNGFDYIVVGSGAGGGTVAARLAQASII
jgi:choline dehydrogenase-like flavoprotein